MSDGYRVQLDVFSGPLDLLLYLIRRDELDIQDIPLARVAEQYLAYVHMLEQIDPNAAGEFLVLAATLLEIKSRALLPSPPLEAADEAADPRTVLVRQLLEYKRFKDAARALGTAAEERARRYVRQPAELPPELQGLELEEVEVWDLLEAFSRVMTAIGQGPRRHDVRYDDTPLELYAAELVAVLEQEGPVTFAALFASLGGRAEVVGRFLALLELIRSHRVRAEQDRNFGTIYIFLLIPVDEPEEPAGEATEPPAAPVPVAEAAEPFTYPAPGLALAEQPDSNARAAAEVPDPLNAAQTSPAAAAAAGPPDPAALLSPAENAHESSEPAPE